MISNKIIFFHSFFYTFTKVCHCDDIFNKIHLVSGDVPISSIHPDNIGEKDINMNNLLKLYNVHKCCPFVHNDLILFSKNNLKFMYEWSLMCIESNTITIWDEYVYNFAC